MVFYASKEEMERILKNVKLSLLSLLLLVPVWACTRAGDSPVKEITVEQVKMKIADSADVVLLDVRTEGEFKGNLGHLPGAVLIPIQELENRLNELDEYKNKEIIVYCRSGNRSGTGAQILNEKGFNAVNMLGGMIEWNEKYGKPDDTENTK